MSKELKNITESVMDEIHVNKIKMRPKIYFIMGSILTFIGLIFSTVVSIFLFGLISFVLRSHGGMASYKLDKMISNFPWWAIVLAIISLTLGIWLLHKYDFSFKVNFKLIIVGFILAVIAGGFIIDMLGLNNVLTRRGPMQGMMRRYIENSDTRDTFDSYDGWGNKVKLEIK